MDKNEDTLLDLENRLRSVGVWGSKSIDDKFAHLLLARHPKATVAVSRCGVIVVPFYNIVENNVAQKCLVCTLFNEASEEVKEHNARKIDKVSIDKTQELGTNLDLPNKP